MVKNKYIYKNNDIQIHVYYNQDVSDTVSVAYIDQLLTQLYINLEKFIPDLYKGFIFEVWSHYREDSPVFNYKAFKNKFVFTTKFLDNDTVSHTLAYMVSVAVAYCFMQKIGFNKKNFIYKKWLTLREGVNLQNPEETFIDDFLMLFCLRFTNIKFSMSTINPYNILGLKSLIYLWYWMNSLKSSFSTLIFWYSFITISKMDYLGFIYFSYNIKLRRFELCKLTTQGFWVYSLINDQWELIKSFSKPLDI